MPDNDSTIHRNPRLRTPDSFILDTAEQSARPDTLLVQIPTVGKVLITVAIGAELIIGRFNLEDMGPLCLNLNPFNGAQQGVSRRHAKIMHSESGWWVQDIGSSNGTWLNGERLQPLRSYALQSTSHLLLSHMEFYAILPDNRVGNRFKTP